MFDNEIMVMAKAYESVPLGMTGIPKMVTRISQLEITWKHDVIEELNPAPLFDMTRYVRDYAGKKPFLTDLARFRREAHLMKGPPSRRDEWRGQQGGTMNGSMGIDHITLCVKDLNAG